MKKIFLFVLCASVAFACAKKSEVDELQNRIEEIKSGQIASINSQISGITLSLGNLQAIDDDLSGYIQTLQQQKDARLVIDNEYSDGFVLHCPLNFFQ